MPKVIDKSLISTLGNDDSFVVLQDSTSEVHRIKKSSVFAELNKELSLTAGSTITNSQFQNNNIFRMPSTGTYTLPLVASNFGHIGYFYRDLAGSSTAAKLDGNGVETINGKSDWNAYADKAGIWIYGSQENNAWIIINSTKSNTESWTPVYSASGSMTYTSVTTDRARWYQDGGSIHWALSASGTTGGTASTTLMATPPVSFASDWDSVTVGFGGFVGDGGSLSGYGFYNLGNINFRRYDTANFGLGGSRQMSCQGWYQID